MDGDAARPARRARAADRSLASAREAVRRRHHGTRAGARRRCACRPVGCRAVRIRIRPIHASRPKAAHADVALPDGRDGARRREPRRIRRRASARTPQRAGAICCRSRVDGCPSRRRRFRGRDVGRIAASTRRSSSAPTARTASSGGSCARRFAATSSRSRPDSSRTASPAIAIVIEMFADPPGYIWSFPRPDHLAIGICAQADAGVGVDALRGMVRRVDSRRRQSQTAPGSSRTRGRFLRCRPSDFAVARSRRPGLVDRRRRGRPRGSDHAGRHFLRAAVRRRGR